MSVSPLPTDYTQDPIPLTRFIIIDESTTLCSNRFCSCCHFAFFLHLPRLSAARPAFRWLRNLLPIVQVGSGVWYESRCCDPAKIPRACVLQARFMRSFDSGNHFPIAARF